MKKTDLRLPLLILTTIVCLFLVGCAPGEAQVEAEIGLSNPNLVGEDALSNILDQELTDKIIDDRPFLSMKAFRTHLSDEEFSALSSQLFIPINLNTASREEILLVPGVGDRMAHEFEEYRPYVNIDQFRREMGKYVDDAEVARLEQFVFIPVSLNAGSDEEILGIPGVGNRMLHEFKEYRPYTDIEQFRREIGKYVDEGEVARLERYVTLN